jgi:DNA-binding LytR/AlgR family response regulator
MKKYRIAICDDDVNTVDLIASSVTAAFGKQGAAVESEIFLSAALLRRALETTPFDLLFLDIQMPKETGLAFGRWLRERGNRTEIVYVSSREDMVFDALTTEPFGFVRKNRFLEDIAQVVSRYLASRQEEAMEQVVVLPQKNGLVRLTLADILYLEGSRKDQLLYRTNGEVLTLHSTMEQLTEQLAGRGFLRIHKGFLVNCRYISALRSDTALLTTGQELPLSRRNSQEIKAQYLAILREQGGLLL